jgi:hypothetical protein
MIAHYLPPIESGQYILMSEYAERIDKSENNVECIDDKRDLNILS